MAYGSCGCECDQLGVGHVPGFDVVMQFVRRDRFAKATIKQRYRSGDLVLGVFEALDERVNGFRAMLSGEILDVGHHARSAGGIA